MILDPRSPAWWRLQRQLYQQELTDIVLSVLFAGAESGLAQLPSGIDVLMDWDAFNEAALDWMHGFLGTPGAPGISTDVFAWVDSIDAVTRKRVATEIDAWVREGTPLSVLEQRLTPVFGDTRARRIAVTEVTRMYASGNLMAWQSTGLVGAKRWMTAVDERVCPVCGPLHNTIVEIDGAWQFTDLMKRSNPQLEKALNSIGANTFTAPPAHVNCRCWLQPVVLEALSDEELEQVGTVSRSSEKVPNPELSSRVPSFTTRKEAEEWVSQYWFMEGADFSSLDLDVVQDMVGRLDALMRTDDQFSLRYIGPQARAARLAGRPLRRSTQDVFTVYGVDKNIVIGYDPTLIANRGVINSTIKSLREQGTILDTNFVEMITHEHGHIIDIVDREGFASPSSDFFRWYTPRAKDRHMQMHFADMTLRQTVGNYITTSHKERFAEFYRLYKHNKLPSGFDFVAEWFIERGL